MKTSNERKAQSAFWKLGAVALITATLAMCFTACKQTGGGNSSGGGGIEGGVSLILSPDKLTIKVKAKTSDGKPIDVEGCTETTLKSNMETELHAKETKVILKGKITELDVQSLTALQKLECSLNKLTTLDVQGCTALEKLSCWNNNLNALNVQGCTTLKSLICWCNKLNAQAMTKLLKALPAREVSDGAEAQLYTEHSQSTSEGNWNDYTKPEDLKKAFEGAKGRNWKLKVQRKLGSWGDI